MCADRAGSSWARPSWWCSCASPSTPTCGRPFPPSASPTPTGTSARLSALVWSVGSLLTPTHHHYQPQRPLQHADEAVRAVGCGKLLRHGPVPAGDVPRAARGAVLQLHLRRHPHGPRRLRASPVSERHQPHRTKPPRSFLVHLRDGMNKKKKKVVKKKKNNTTCLQDIRRKW